MIFYFFILHLEKRVQKYKKVKNIHLMFSIVAYIISNRKKVLGVEIVHAPLNHAHAF